MPADCLVSPLRLADCRLLRPGAIFDPTRAEGRRVLPLLSLRTSARRPAGAYELSLTLSTESASPEDWLGRFGQDAERARVLERIAEVPRLTASAKAAVTVR